jgi:hypothetical protein
MVTRKLWMEMFEGHLFGHIHALVLQCKLGVSRGSVRGPLCCILHINDLSNAVQHCKLKLYADGMKMYTTFIPNLWVNDL